MKFPLLYAHWRLALARAHRAQRGSPERFGWLQTAELLVVRIQILQAASPQQGGHRD